MTPSIATAAIVLGLCVLVGCGGESAQSQTSLLAYRKQAATQLPPHDVEVDAAEGLAGLGAGDAVRIALPQGRTLTGWVRHRSEGPPGTVALAGSLAGEAGGKFSLALSGQALSGSVRQGGQRWEIRARPRGGVIEPADDPGAGMPGNHPPDVFKRFLQDQVPPGGASGLPGLPVLQAARKAASAQDIAWLDALVVADAAMYAAYGSDDAVKATAARLVAAANQAFMDSEAHLQLRVAGYARVGASYAGKDLRVLWDALDGRTGEFATLWPTELAAGADLVIGFTALDAAKGGVCGLGSIGWFQDGQLVTARPSAASVAVAFGPRRADGFICPDSIVGHEVGHVLGVLHDRAHDGISAYRAFPYSYGYGEEGRFGDIMSYIRPKVDFFSNPRLALCAGRPCGTVDDDAVRTFNQTAPLVAEALDGQSRLNGWYVESAGTGWAVEARHGRIFVAAFVYDEAGQPTWVAGAGAACAGRLGTWCVGLDEYAGGQGLVGSHQSPRMVRRVADAELVFTGEPASLEVRIGTRRWAARRLLFAGDGALATRPAAPGSPLPAWYWNPATPGTGIFMDRQKDIVFAGTFYFRPDGSPTWAIAAGRNYRPGGVGRATALPLPLERYAGGQTLTGEFRPAVLANAQEGSIELGIDQGSLAITSIGVTRREQGWRRFAF